MIMTRSLALKTQTVSVSTAGAIADFVRTARGYASLPCQCTAQLARVV